jgi:hypothetical protein
VLESGVADNAFVLLWKLQGVSCALCNVSESGDVDDSMCICSSLEMTVCELCIVEYRMCQRVVMLMMIPCPFILLWK